MAQDTNSNSSNIIGEIGDFLGGNKQTQSTTVSTPNTVDSNTVIIAVVVLGILAAAGLWWATSN